MITKKMICALSILSLTSGMYAAQQLPKTATGFNKGLSLAQQAIESGDFNEARDYINQLRKINPRSKEVSRLEAALNAARSGAQIRAGGEQETAQVRQELAEAQRRSEEALRQSEEQSRIMAGQLTNLINEAHAGRLEKTDLENQLQQLQADFTNLKQTSDAKDQLSQALAKNLRGNIDKLLTQVEAKTKTIDQQADALTAAEKELKETKATLDAAKKAAGNTTRFANAFTKAFVDGYQIDQSGLRGLPEELNTLDKIINAQILVNQTFKLMWDKAINNQSKRNWLNVSQEGLGVKLKGLISSKVLSPVDEE